MWHKNKQTRFQKLLIFCYSQPVSHRGGPNWPSCGSEDVLLLTGSQQKYPWKCEVTGRETLLTSFMGGHNWPFRCLDYKHCQRHNGPEGWVHITRSHFTVHKSWTYYNRKSIKQLQNLNQTSAFRLNLKLKSWPNLVSGYWPIFNFVTSTKHQQ